MCNSSIYTQLRLQIFVFQNCSCMHTALQKKKPPLDLFTSFEKAAAIFLFFSSFFSRSLSGKLHMGGGFFFGVLNHVHIYICTIAHGYRKKSFQISRTGNKSLVLPRRPPAIGVFTTKLASKNINKMGWKGGTAFCLRWRITLDPRWDSILSFLGNVTVCAVDVG